MDVVFGDVVGDVVGVTLGVVVGETDGDIVGVNVVVSVGVTVGKTVGDTVGEAFGPTLAHPHSSNAAVKHITITKAIVFFKIFASFAIIFYNKEANYNLISRNFFLFRKKASVKAAVPYKFPQYAVAGYFVVFFAGLEIIQKFHKIIRTYIP